MIHDAELAARDAGQAGAGAPALLIGGLVLACAAGDREAFRRLYALTAPAVFGVLVAMLRDREAAADLAQEVYVAVWRSAESFRPERSDALAWLMTIARNRALDRLRAGRISGVQAPVEDVPDLAADLPPGGAVDAVVLRRALAALRPELRRALALVVLRGYTLDELAHTLNVPASTSRSWVRHGLMALREALP